MTKEEAIAVLEKEASIIDDNSIEMTAREWDEFDDLKRDAIPVAIEALSSEAVQGWIPCSERLPDEEGEYIATVSADGGHMYIGIIYYGKPLMPNRKVNGKCWYHSDDEWGDVVYG